MRNLGWVNRKPASLNHMKQSILSFAIPVGRNSNARGCLRLSNIRNDITVNAGEHCNGKNEQQGRGTLQRKNEIKGNRVEWFEK